MDVVRSTNEILKIENRHRVTAILIPNKHLETPHYKLDRLKHDDPRLEEAHVSYAMAEQADTDIGYSKRQKDDVKPRQEAMVKSITPETAPIVERKPAPAPTSAKEVASGGLFAGIAKFFSSIFGGAEEKSPVVEEKPKHNRDKQGDRSRQRNRGRNGNGNGRNGRNAGAEGEERPANPNNQQKEASKETNKLAANEQNNQPRQAKQARPTREEKEGQEPRRERQQRQRDNRKDKDNSNTEAKSEELNEAAVPTAINVAPVLNKAKNSEPQEVVVDTNAELGTEQNEPGAQSEEGRRRRRGGRNRNRRDRNGNENNDAVNGNSENNGETKVEAAPAFIPVVDLLNNATAIEAATPDTTPVQASFDLAPASTETTVAATQVNAVVASATELPVEVSAEVVAAVVAELPTQLPTQLPIQEVAAVVSTQVANQAEAEVGTHVETQLAPAAEMIATPVVAVSAATAESTEIMASVAAVAPIPAPIETAITVPAASSMDTTAVATAVTEVAPTSAPASAPVANLDVVLANAGLVLAATDPAKLKAAQDVAATVTPQVKLGRERKASAVLADEPLVMVETKN